MKIKLHTEALLEYEGAVTYYEQRQAGLGRRFIAAVETAFENIQHHPERWPFLEQDVRRHLTRVFPYAVLYTIESDFVLVVSIMHCHQKPGYWRTRVTGT